tara:strand:+ start:185 stop:409 length:225 start_codon:yes stop_codon:yes gene_type:complete
MIKTKTLIFSVVIIFSIITGFLLYQEYKVEETLINKPVLTVKSLTPGLIITVIKKDDWEFKHCTPTNKNCGRFE